MEKLRQADRLEAAIGLRFHVRAEEYPRSVVPTREALADFALSTGDLNPRYFDAHQAEPAAEGTLTPPITWFNRLAQPNLAVSALAKTNYVKTLVYDGQQPPPATDSTGAPDF
jgi:hypothetical protein